MNFRPAPETGFRVVCAGLEEMATDQGNCTPKVNHFRCVAVALFWGAKTVSAISGDPRQAVTTVSRVTGSVPPGFDARIGFGVDSVHLGSWCRRDALQASHLCSYFGTRAGKFSHGVGFSRRRRVMLLLGLRHLGNLASRDAWSAATSVVVTHTPLHSGARMVIIGCSLGTSETLGEIGEDCGSFG